MCITPVYFHIRTLLNGKKKWNYIICDWKVNKMGNQCVQKLALCNFICGWIGCIIEFQWMHEIELRIPIILSLWISQDENEQSKAKCVNCQKGKMFVWLVLTTKSVYSNVGGECGWRKRSVFIKRNKAEKRSHRSTITKKKQQQQQRRRRPYWI